MRFAQKRHLFIFFIFVLHLVPPTPLRLILLVLLWHGWNLCINHANKRWGVGPVNLCDGLPEPDRQEQRGAPLLLQVELGVIAGELLHLGGEALVAGDEGEPGFGEVGAEVDSGKGGGEGGAGARPGGVYVDYCHREGVS